MSHFLLCSLSLTGFLQISARSKNSSKFVHGDYCHAAACSSATPPTQHVDNCNYTHKNTFHDFTTNLTHTQKNRKSLSCDSRFASTTTIKRSSTLESTGRTIVSMSCSFSCGYVIILFSSAALQRRSGSTKKEERAVFLLRYFKSGRSFPSRRFLKQP